MIPLPQLTAEDFYVGAMLLSPAIVVGLTAVFMELLDLFPPDWARRRFLLWIASGGLLTALALSGWLLVGGWVGRSAFDGFIVMDHFALYFQVLLVVAALLVLLSSTSFMDRQERFEGEFYGVTLFCTTGLMLMVAGNELITIYLGLELSSLSLAFLAAWNKRERLALGGLKSTEAGMKFFLLSAMSTAVLLYGMALLYGLTGATTLVDIASVLTQQPDAATLLAVSMLVAGLGFKISAAPFQLWTPDVYQGAPTPVTAFFSVASKAAGFAVILRIFNTALPAITPEWATLFGVLAFVTMTVGNLIALVQTNIKRMMAYSSITHVGYVLIGLAAASPFGTSGVLYYMLAYTLTNLAAFIVITIMARYVPDDEIAGYAGLHQRSPWLAIALTAALLSLAGIPPFVGFWAKLYLFLAAIERGLVFHQVLVVWAVIMTAISLYYYGRVIHTMWMREPSEASAVQPAFSQNVALAASVFGVVVVGIFAAPFLSAAQVAANSLFR